MTPNEITTLIGTNLGKELDTRFKLQLYERVKYWRSTLIKQSLDKVRQDMRFFRQTIYVPMEKVNTLECAPELQCFKSRSTIEIPKAIRVTDVGEYSYVGGIDGYSPFGYADPGTLKFLKSGKYSRLLNHHEFINRKVLTSVPDLPKIRIDGVFDNPEEALPYENCDAAPDVKCDWWNINIPMSGDIEQRVVQCILTVDYNRPVNTNDHQIQVNAGNTKQ